jgi:integrative and conjugative element protein (TIGR02256 family)
MRGRREFTLDLHASVMRTMRQEAGRTFPLETGGVLLGQSTSHHTSIGVVIGPGPNANHRCTGFQPDRDWQYEQIAIVFKQLGGVVQYLGDWHTHPDGSTLPSSLDRQLLRDISSDLQSRCERPVMAILGGNDHHPATEFFRYVPARRIRRDRLVSLLRIDV